MNRIRRLQCYKIDFQISSGLKIAYFKRLQRTNINNFFTENIAQTRICKIKFLLQCYTISFLRTML